MSGYVRQCPVHTNFLLTNLQRTHPSCHAFVAFSPGYDPSFSRKRGRLWKRQQRKEVEEHSELLISILQTGSSPNKGEKSRDCTRTCWVIAHSELRTTTNNMGSTTSTTTVNIRLACEADRATICQLVVSNHLSLSEDCPVEWVEQFQDVTDDYAHLFHADKFATGWYVVAEQVTSATTTTTTGDEVVDGVSAKKSTIIVGVAGMIPKGSSLKTKVWIVTAVSVQKGCRRHGLGEKLLRRVLSDARDDMLGITRLELETLKEIMEPAWRLYEKLGFKREKESIAFRVGPGRPRPMTVLQYSLDL